MLRQNTAISLREKCPYSKFFWSAFSRFQSKCGKIRPEKLRIRTFFMHCLPIKAATNQERSRESEFLSFISSFQLYYLYSCIQFSYIICILYKYFLYLQKYMYFFLKILNCSLLVIAMSNM